MTKKKTKSTKKKTKLGQELIKGLQECIDGGEVICTFQLIRQGGKLILQIVEPAIQNKLNSAKD